MKQRVTIAYVVSTLKRVGPTNQTLNIIKNSIYKNDSIVITLFNENPNDTMVDLYKKNNIKVICLNLNKKLFIFQMSKIKKILKEINPSIVHTYGIIPDCLISKIHTKRTSWKHLITLRNFPREDILTRMGFFKGHLALCLHSHAIKNSENVVCCSKTIANKMNDLYKTNRYMYIQNGVDIELYKDNEVSINSEIRNSFNISNDKIVFLSTNSFIPRKRIDETIQLFNSLPEDNKLLILAGEGPLYSSIYDENISSTNIKFVGKISNVSDYLNISDYFISSSESEGLPNSVLEAIACGTPIIVSDIPQHKEIFDELGEVGIIYQLGNINDCVQKYKKYNSENYNVYKKNCSKIYSSPFTMKNMSENYVKLYEKIGEINNEI